MRGAGEKKGEIIQERVKRKRGERLRKKGCEGKKGEVKGVEGRREEKGKVLEIDKNQRGSR